MRIEHGDRPGVILRRLPETLAGGVDEPDGDAVGLGLVEFEGDPGLGVLAALEGGPAQRDAASVDIGLVLLQFAAGFFDLPDPQEGLSEQVVGSGMQPVRVEPDAFLERGDGRVPLFHSGAGESELEEGGGDAGSMRLAFSKALTAASGLAARRWAKP